MQKNEKQLHTSDALKKFYGQEYVDKFLVNQSPSRLERLTKYIDLRSDYCVADYACGSGMLMPYIAPKVNSYIGIDFSQEFIDAANNAKKSLNFKNAEFFCSEIKDFCARNIDKFDCALPWTSPNMCQMINGRKSSLRSLFPSNRAESSICIPLTHSSCQRS